MTEAAEQIGRPIELDSHTQKKVLTGVTGFSGKDRTEATGIDDLFKANRLPNVAYTISQLGSAETEWLRRGGWTNRNKNRELA